MKSKITVVLCIVSVIVSAAMIAADLLLFDIPVWVPVVTGAFSLLMMIFILAAEHKKGTKISLSVFTLFFTVLTMFGSICDPYWNSQNFRINGRYTCIGYDEKVTSQAAVNDLDYTMKLVEKVHPKCKDGIPDEVNTKYLAVREELLSDRNITVNELTVKIESVLTLFSDGHTSVAAMIPKADRRYLKADKEMEAKGYDISKVNGMTIDELAEKYRSYFSFETDTYLYDDLKNALIQIDKLDYLGIDTNDVIEFTFEDTDGNIQIINAYSDDFVAYEEYIGEENKTDNSPFVYYDIDEEKSLALLTLKMCRYTDVYKDTLHSMFTEIKAKGIKNVAVDLRNNSGGNSLVVNEFIRYLDIDEFFEPTKTQRFGPFMIDCGTGKIKNRKYEDLLFDGNVYLLTAPYTFSSAMMFAEIIKDNKLGTIVGEAPGNIAWSCGENTIFSTPEAGISLYISTSQFKRADRDNKELLVIPDIECRSEDALEFIPL